jgi:hypothetical protein
MDRMGADESRRTQSLFTTALQASSTRSADDAMFGKPSSPALIGSRISAGPELGRLPLADTLLQFFLFKINICIYVTKQICNS